MKVEVLDFLNFVCPNSVESLLTGGVSYADATHKSPETFWEPSQKEKGIINEMSGQKKALFQELSSR